MSESQQQSPPDSVPVPPQLEDIDCEDSDEKGVFIVEEELQQTQNNVKALMDINIEIKELAAALAQRRKQQKELQKGITGYMQTNKIPHFDMSSKGKLHLVTTKRKQTLSTKWIAGQLKSIDGLTEQMQIAILEALESRPVKEIAKLSHKA